MEIGLEAIRDAARNLKQAKVIIPSPPVRALELEGSVECDEDSCIYLKPENFQRTGSYKARGAYTCIRKKHETSGDSVEVVTASAGNHAQGVAYAAAEFGLPYVIFMPFNTPEAKVSATFQHCSCEEVEDCSHIARHENPDDPTEDNKLSGYHEAKDAAKRYAEENDNRVRVPAFNDRDIITGQATAGWEVYWDLAGSPYDVAFEEYDSVNVLVPVGGGGLLAGTCLTLQPLLKDVTNLRIYGVQSEAHSAAHENLKKYRENPEEFDEIEEVPTDTTICDGSAVRKPGEIPFGYWKDIVEDIVLVSEKKVRGAILFMFERCHVLLEGAGALGIAALQGENPEVELSRKSLTVVLLSGGNIDVTKVSRVLETELVSENRLEEMYVTLDDEPGQLQEMLKILSSAQINILDIDRVRAPIHPTRVVIKIVVECRGSEHAQRVRQQLEEECEKLNDDKDKGNFEVMGRTDVTNMISEAR